MNEEVGVFNKQVMYDFLLYMKYVYPEVRDRQWRAEQELKQQNPFWPLSPPPADIIEKIRKWAEE